MARSSTLIGGNRKKLRAKNKPLIPSLDFKELGKLIDYAAKYGKGFNKNEITELERLGSKARNARKLSVVPKNLKRKAGIGVKPKKSEGKPLSVQNVSKEAAKNALDLARIFDSSKTPASLESKLKKWVNP